MNKPFERRLYTQMFIDQGTDGKYIRSTLREEMPNLWSKVSRQLYNGGYKFDEMLEYSEKIPTALLQ